MTILFIILLIITILPSVLFKNYRADFSEKLNKKEHTLYFFYGFAYYLTDKFLVNLSIFSHTKKNASLIYPQDKPEKMAYLILARRISISLVTAIICFSSGLCYSLTFTGSNNKEITELQRSSDGSSVSYSLNINSEAETELVDITVPAKTYTTEQTLNILNKSKDGLINIILDKNKDVSHVSENLYFPDYIGDDNISVTVEPEDISLIDPTGVLLYDNIPSSGISTTIVVKLELNEISTSFSFNLTLCKKESDTAEKYKKEIEKYISENSSPDSDNVVLPKKLNNKPVSYTINEEDLSFVFIISGLCALFIFFILSGNETKNKLHIREELLLKDFPDIISKLLLLSNAGLTIPNALFKICEDYKNKSSDFSYAYEELALAINGLKNGKSQSKVYSEFGKRCGLMPYIKLSSLLQQSIHKGSKDFKIQLRAEVTNAFNNYRSNIIMYSKRAETKLLLPMIIILIVIMAIIIIPSFMKF